MNVNFVIKIFKADTNIMYLNLLMKRRNSISKMYLHEYDLVVPGLTIQFVVSCVCETCENEECEGRSV